jgi:hypothetical protein
MIIKSEIVKGIHIYHVQKEIKDDKMEENFANCFLKRTQIKRIIQHDADVYSYPDNILLAKYRKSILPQSHIDVFFDNVIEFAKNVSSNRGSATGSKSKTLGDNPKVMSNIFGYFDQWSASQKLMFTSRGMKIPVAVRECRFNRDHPEKFKETLPLIQDIDKLYKRLTPEYYKKQCRKANQTHFRIPKTSFTTVTTNINYQTTVHTDKGDDPEGFGNLVVLEKGKYNGGETCFPQYGIGFDVRTGDILFMDVHQWHGNLPIELVEKDAIRLSIVCYLRKNIWERTKNKTKRFMILHNKTVRRAGNKKVK